MKEIELLQDYEGYKVGDTIKVKHGIAEYLVRTNVALFKKVKDCGCGCPKPPTIEDIVKRPKRVKKS